MLTLPRLKLQAFQDRNFAVEEEPGPLPRRARLTRRNLKAFDTMGREKKRCGCIWNGDGVWDDKTDHVVVGLKVSRGSPRKRNIGFNDDLPPAQPDMIEGPKRTQLHPFMAERQAAYDGACLTHGRNVARDFLGKPDRLQHAYIQTFTTDGTVLRTFAHHSSESRGRMDYHKTATSYSVTLDNFQGFRTGRRYIRNLQDHAKKLSEELRDELLQHASVTSPSENGDRSDGEVSAAPIDEYGGHPNGLDEGAAGPAKSDHEHQPYGIFPAMSVADPCRDRLDDMSIVDGVTAAQITFDDSYRLDEEQQAAWQADHVSVSAAVILSPPRPVLLLKRSRRSVTGTRQTSVADHRGDRGLNEPTSWYGKELLE
ncbi:heterokaryon incompatibility protein [Drepanopeziza brunnea f. sp. 'multigermtubi' MB_m1]|uniref:Heterokaryon incompatibility protein n=1 Tax=Marssonina brunnea f. sp. multigermtubi (strain MB_m1) TaxID=1072389 RepID=K1XBA3_MARBU|nr:heterokaryon incompatibility protein [Drepanopeziza brunnea f. sp. 'multigermtubi' MB_m1]EKD18003.1 heterokaryon incompatibility protein [Drepanopeziza brunnea f. sp. 'multigermtubi' MB_m1]